MSIRILPQAERDLELRADFYESQRQGLGGYFNGGLMADMESLTPESTRSRVVLVFKAKLHPSGAVQLGIAA